MLQFVVLGLMSVALNTEVAILVVSPSSALHGELAGKAHVVQRLRQGSGVALGRLGYRRPDLRLQSRALACAQAEPLRFDLLLGRALRSPDFRKGAPDLGYGLTLLWRDRRTTVERLGPGLLGSQHRAHAFLAEALHSRGREVRQLARDLLVALSGPPSLGAASFVLGGADRTDCRLRSL